MELPKTNEDGMIALGLKAKETGADSFLVKIERKGAFGLPESLTSCEGVELKYIIKPEEWLPTLFGGGNFILTCYHVSEQTVPVARLALNFKGEPTMNWTALDGGTWSGPKNFTRREAPAGTTFSEGEPGDRRPPGYGGGSRLGAGAWGPPPPWYAPPQAQNQAIDKVLDAMKESQRQAELQRLQDRADMTRMFDKLSQPAPKPALDVVALLTAAAPLFAIYKESERTTRLEQLKMADHQQQETKELLKAIGQPKPIDPTLETLIKDQRRLIEKLSEGGGESEQTMQMMNVMQTMFGFTSKAIAAAAEAQLKNGDKDGGWLPAFREVATSLEHIFTARMGARAAQPGQQAIPSAPPPQLPPGQATTVDEVFQAVIAHHDPKLVAARVVELAESDDPAFVAEIGKYENNIVELAQARLSFMEDGTLWYMIPKHQAYLRTLMELIERAPAFGGPEPVAPKQVPKPVAVQPAPAPAPAPVQAAPAPAAVPEKVQEGGAKPATPAPTPAEAAPTVVDFTAPKQKKRRTEKPDLSA